MIQNNSSFRLPVLLAGIVVLIASRYSACKGIYELWLSSEDFNGLWLVPLFTCIVIWQNKEKLLDFQWRTFLLPLIPLSVIIIFQLFGQPTSPRKQILLLMPSIWLLTLTVIGWRAAKHISAPLLLSILTIPPPAWLWQEITLTMQYLSSKASASIYGLLAPMSCQGFSIFLHTSQKWEVVGPECSGARSLLGLCVVCWFLILASEVKPTAGLALAMSVPVIALFFNICRIVLTFMLRDHHLDKDTADFCHGLTGIIVFIIGILTVVGLIRVVRNSTGKELVNGGRYLHCN